MYYNSNFGGQVQQPMPQQMPMHGQGPYPVMDNRLSALEMQMKQGQQNPNLYGGRQQPQQMQVPTQQQFIKAIPVTSFDEAKAAADTGLFVVVSSNLCTRNCGTVTHIPVTTTSSVAEA